MFFVKVLKKTNYCQQKCLCSFFTIIYLFSQGLTTSAVEGACVVIFSSVVAPYLPVFLLLPLLNGVFGMTMFVEEILQAKVANREMKIRKVLILLKCRIDVT